MQVAKTRENCEGERITVMLIAPFDEKMVPFTILTTTMNDTVLSSNGVAKFSMLKTDRMGEKMREKYSRLARKVM